MYELSRVRLYSVGPPGARYEDVTIDLSQVGKPLPHAQLVLLDEGHLVRPSPATVLFLENGGGKSVLIKLIFSVMLPGKRRIVGTSNTRVLENFVERGDVAHVVLEWMHTETGRLLITGKVSQWQPRKNAVDEGMVETWYSLRPGPSVGIASLPFAEAGQNLVASEFRARLSDLDDHDPSLELFWADRHNKWTDRLTTLGLDPELFEFQRRMNSGEGEAAEAFTFSSDEALIDFLLKSVLPDEDATSLADSLEEYAGKLSERDALELERDFVTAALHHLEPLAEQHASVEAAQRLVADRAAERDRFMASIVARIERERARSEEQAGLLELAGAAVESARTDRAEARAVEAELTRRVADFRVREAKAALETVERDVGDIEALVEGWKATGALIDWSTKDQNHRHLQEVLDQKQDAQATAQRIRDTRAGALIRALLDVRQRAEHAAATEDTEVTRLAAEAKHAEGTRDEAIVKAAAARAMADQLDTSVAEVVAEVEAAVRDGLVPDAASVPAAADALAETAQTAAAAVIRHEERIAELDAGVDSAQAVLADAQSQETAARADHDLAAAAMGTAKAAMDALAAQERLIELVDGPDVVLEIDAEALIEALTDALTAADRDRTGLHVAEAADRRARVALDSGDGALYPPPPEIEELVELLRDEHIRCHSGWEVLADFPDEDKRRELVARLPHLAAGVLLNDPDDLERAARVVAVYGYEPTCLVTVATTQSFDVETRTRFDLTPRGDAGFVVPPHRALYDHVAARAESTRINERHVERQHDITELDARYTRDQQLKARLIQWRAEYPPGRHAELSGQQSAAADRLAEAKGMVHRGTAALDEAKRVRGEARGLLAERVRDARAAEARATRAALLRTRVDQVEGWRRSAAAARATEQTETERAEQQLALRDAYQEQANEHRRTADQHRATVERVREEIAEAGGESLADLDAGSPTEPVPVLRQSLRDAQTTYIKAQVGSDFLVEVEMASKAAIQAKSVLDTLPEPVRDRAALLLTTPDGVDVAGRAAVLEKAKAKLVGLAEDRDGALGRLHECKARYDQLPAPSTSVVLAPEPNDISHAQQLLADAGAALYDAEINLLRKEQDHAQLVALVKRTETALAGFTRITDAMAAAGDNEPDSSVVTAAYKGHSQDAWEHNIELRKKLKEAREALGRAQNLVNQTAEALRTAVSETRFHALVSAARTQITTVASSELSRHAENWSASLRPRLRSITDDLVQSDRHRAFIIERLQGMVESALRTLRQAQRLSRLPAGLGDWSGEEFLRFTFTQVEGDVLAQQLSQVVDEAAHGSAVKRDGTSLLLRGVRAAAPKGFKVTMLKPDAVLRTERVRVSEIHDVFSGGQHLTAAILLYCTLAALRANNQGRAHQHHSGVLFLDNPIGRASAGYLLDLQRAVAEALGVQLVYTTGLFDAEALGAFPLVVRMRNDADLRAGRKYLSVDMRVRAALDNLADPDGVARLSASRVLLKERQRDNQD